MTELKTCDGCGKEFQQQPDEVVVSSKTLCQSCAAARLAQRRAGAASSVTVARKRAPQAAAAEPIRRAARPAPAAKAETVPEHHFDAVKRREQEFSRSAKIGWIAVGVGTLVVGGILLVVMNELSSRQAAVDQELEARKTFHAAIMSVSMTSEDALKLAKERIAKERSTWKNTPIEGEVTAQLAKINGSLQGIIRSRGFVEQLSGIEAKLKGSPDTRVLGDLFTSVRDPELKERAVEGGEELTNRLNSVSRAVSDLYVENLRAAATAAAGAKSGRELEPFGTLEDTLRALGEDAQRANDVDANARFTGLHKTCVKEINEITRNLFTPEYINTIAWVDLIADPSVWMPVPSSSFKFSFGGSGLVLTNEAGETSSSGGLSYGPGDRWRDYVVEMEFTLNSGTMVFYTRVGQKMDSKAVPAFTMGGKTPNVLVEYGKPYVLTVVTIAGQLHVLVDGAQVYSSGELGYNKSRVGEPGIVVQAGTSATIVRLRARQLR